MSNQPPSSLNDELNALGRNLSSLFKSAWESPERQSLQGDLENGLKQASEAINRAANEFSASEAGQRLQAEVADIRRRVESGELQSQARGDLLNALQKLNNEIQKAASAWSSRNTPPTPGGES
ncbi:MAG TPA: hypothetical protein PKW33_14330 [Anaerolineaceae bacterium]|nr:hypothetical protein [Anaerolineaceae bacterium]HPN52766.1 hypothetical protein [Anaerolineaceae bacterium]